MNNKIKNIVTTVVFVAFIAVFVVMCVFRSFEPVTYSPLEKRPMAQFPENITWEGIVDKTVIDGFEGGIDEDAAKEFSTCPSGQRGGSLGDFGKGQMVPEFDNAVFSMEVGEITSTPVQTQFGYHLIKLNSKNPAQPTPFEAIAEQLKEMLVGQKRRDAYQSRVNQLKILYPVDLV